MSELISIVLPVYNGARFLSESIDSVLDQTYKNWELIIVDDCSTDNSPEIVNSYVKKDSRIHYYRNERNLKLPANLNKGFSLTSGDYLTWTSDDNRYKPKALEIMLEKLKMNQPAQLIYASYQVINENGEVIGEKLADPKGSQHILGANIVGACFLYTREAMEKTGLYDPDLFLVEDFDYWQRMFTQVKTTYVSQILYEYRWHSDSLTSTKREKQYGQALEKMLKKNRSSYGKLSEEASRYYIKCLYVARKKQGGFNQYAVPYRSSQIKFWCKRAIKKVLKIS